MRKLANLFTSKNKGRKYYRKMSNDDLMDLFQLMMIDPRFDLSVRQKVAELVMECENNQAG